MTTAFLPGVLVLPARDAGAGAAKRARDEVLLDLSDEADSRGWSSSVLERSLALRCRRGTASSSPRRGCGWIASASVAAATAEEHECCREEAATVGADSEVEEKATADPCSLAYCSNSDLPDFDPPPMAIPLLPLCAFITDLWKTRNNDRVVKRARDDDLLTLSEETDARRLSADTSPTSA